MGPIDGVWAVFATHEEVRENCAQPQSRKSHQKRLCMPVRGECLRAAWREVLYRFLTITCCFVRLRFTFSVVLYKYIRLLTSSLSPNILGPLRSCFVLRH
jgi:hypothetical protein